MGFPSALIIPRRARVVSLYLLISGYKIQASLYTPVNAVYDKAYAAGDCERYQSIPVGLRCQFNLARRKVLDWA